MTAPVQVPVCRFCGSEELRSLELRVEWRIVDFVPDAEHGWVTGDEWGDEQGDSDSQTVGIVCGDCYRQTGGPGDEPYDARALITTRAAYNRTHPARAWWVPVERYVGPPMTGEREQARHRVMARDEREAMTAASQSGMVNGRYPWIASSYRARPWLVGTPDPNRKEAAA